MKLLLILLVALFSEANQQYADGNYAEAVQMYEQILQEQPTLTSNRANSRNRFSLTNVVCGLTRATKMRSTISLLPSYASSIILKTTTPSLSRPGSVRFVTPYASRRGCGLVSVCLCWCLLVHCSLRLVKNNGSAKPPSISLS